MTHQWMQSAVLASFASFAVVVAAVLPIWNSIAVVLLGTELHARVTKLH